MQEVLALALNSMHHDMARVERISLNLANALTPAYKRDVVSVSAQPSAIGSFQSLVTSDAAQAQAASPQTLRVHTDWRPATLRATQQPLDLALTGAGYFEVQTPEGPAYTRQGNFGLDGNGRLVTAQGLPVMGTGGEIMLANASPSIDDSGRIYDRTVPGVTDRTPMAQLKIIGVDKTQTLQKLGNGLYAIQGDAPAPAETTSTVRQGYLENSNVSSMQEMVQLIQTMRHFESMQKVALGYDEMIGTAIRKLGDPV